MNKSKQKKESLIKRLRNRSLVKDTRGLNTVEYAILLVLIVVVSYSLWDTFGGKIKGGVNKANQKVQIDKKK